MPSKLFTFSRSDLSTSLTLSLSRSLPYITLPPCETEVKDGAALRTAHLRDVRVVQLHAGALWHGEDGNPLPMSLQLLVQGVQQQCLELLSVILPETLELVMRLSLNWSGWITPTFCWASSQCHSCYPLNGLQVPLVRFHHHQEVLCEGGTGQQAHQLSFPDVILK